MGLLLMQLLKAVAHMAYGMPQNTSVFNESTNQSGLGINETNGTGPPPYYTNLEAVILIFFMTLLSIVTVGGNLLVIFAFYIDRSIRIPSNYFILSLAVSDFLIGLEGFPIFTVYVVLKRWTMGWFMCDLWLSVDYVVCLASIYTVLMITIDRFCSVRMATKYRTWRTQGKVEMMIVVVWLIPTILFFLTIFGWSTFVGERTVPKDFCYVQFMTNPYFNMSMYIAYYWSTLVVMLVLYAGIYQAAQRLQKKSTEKQKRFKEIQALRVSIKKGEKNETKQESQPDQTVQTDCRPSSESSHSSFYIAEQQRLRRQSAEKADRLSVSVTRRVSIHNLAQVIKAKQKWKKMHKEREFASTLSPMDYVSQDRSHSLRGCEFELDAITRQERLLVPGTLETTQQSSSYLSDGQNDSDCVAAAVPIQTPTESKIPIVSSCETRTTSTTQQQESTNQDSGYAAESSQLRTTELSCHQFDACEKCEQHEAVTHTKSTTLISYSTAPFDPFCSMPTADLSDISYIDDYESMDATDKTFEEIHSQVNHGDSNSTYDITDTTQEYLLGFHRDVIRLNSTSQGTKAPGRKFTHGSRKYSFKKFTQLLRVSRKTKGHTENRARKALKTITIILGAFIFFWTPFYVVATVYGFCVECVPVWLYEASYYLCYMNSPINPFCYALANAQFKKAFMRILRGDFKRVR